MFESVLVIVACIIIVKSCVKKIYNKGFESGKNTYFNEEKEKSKD